MHSQQPFLPYARQSIDDDDIAAVEAVLRGDFLTGGPMVPAFEEGLAEKTGAGYAVACSSGTAGLHLAMLALGIGPGDAVVVPSITFLATANVVRHVGAKVVFADVDSESGLMEAEHLDEALRRAGEAKIKAVIPVHLGGQCADMGKIASLAGERNIRIVEDACHAIGGRYQGKAVGGCATGCSMAVFSFHPVKTIAMGEGGAVTTNDKALRDKLALMRNHGMTRDADTFTNDGLAFDENGEPNPWYYEMAEAGFNYRASDIHCALGLSQLGKLETFVAGRRELAARYDQLLASLAPTVRPVKRAPNCEPAWHLYQVLIDFKAAGITRAELMRRMRADGIGTQVHYIPVHRQPYYRERCGDPRVDGAEVFYGRTLSLPLFAGMETKDAERVAVVLARHIGT